VFFPHQAYGVQLSFMSKVITALEHGDNALLEAPTGGCPALVVLLRATTLWPLALTEHNAPQAPARLCPCCVPPWHGSSAKSCALKMA
jgi:hypothetical protein